MRRTKYEDDDIVLFCLIMYVDNYDAKSPLSLCVGYNYSQCSRIYMSLTNCVP